MTKLGWSLKEISTGEPCTLNLFSKILPIILKLCLMLRHSYYSQNYAGIFPLALTGCDDCFVLDAPYEGRDVHNIVACMGYQMQSHLCGKIFVDPIPNSGDGPPMYAR